MRTDAIDRYRNETLRVYGVLEIHLSGKYTGQTKEYLAGKGAGKYSVADIKVCLSSCSLSTVALPFNPRWGRCSSFC